MEFIANSWNHFVDMVRNDTHVIYFILPFYLVSIFAEGIYYFFANMRYNLKDAATSLSISAFNTLFGAFVGGVIHLAIYTYLYDNFRLWEVPYTAWGWIFVFLLHDFFYFAEHWLSHRMGLLWSFHQVHHSSQELNFTTANRGTFLDMFASNFFWFMPILGVDFLQFAVIIGATNLWGIFNHTKLIKNMGFLEYILATPSNHSVHHASNLKYLDKNYGQVLIIWDIIFDTFQREEKNEQPKYGLTTNIETYNPVKTEFAGFRWLFKQINSSDNWKDKLCYLIYPPGWSHTGNHERTEDMIEKHAKQKDYAIQEI
jgi:sterol desaturase/sphingolipid hydroxylase (fatty acid hydroxylase superfamily)